MDDIYMQAIRLHDYGAPEALALERVPRPEPQAGQVLVHITAAGVNPADWKTESGMYRGGMPMTFPWIPGLEAAGVVEAAGSGVTAFKPGHTVYGPIRNSYAEYGVIAEDELQSKPANLTYNQAASVSVGALTAWGVLFEAAQLQSGQRVLVHGAAGGVGLFLVQLAHWKGADVAGTASTGNLDFVRSLGADQAIDYKKTDFEDVVRDMDLVVDTVGGDLSERSLKVLRPGGILISIAARPSPEMGQAHNVRVLRAGRAPVDRLAQINQLLEQEKIKAVVQKVFPLEEARQATELCKTGHGRGRIILKVGN
jgi:NADPH:quinone reductase-like Zn-dependent oxidoreductase